MPAGGFFHRYVGAAASLAVLAGVLLTVPVDADAASHKGGRAASSRLRERGGSGVGSFVAGAVVGAYLAGGSDGAEAAHAAPESGGHGGDASRHGSDAGHYRGDAGYRQSANPADHATARVTNGTGELDGTGTAAGGSGTASSAAEPASTATMQSGLDFATFRTWANADLALLNHGYEIPASAKPEDNGASAWRTARILVKDGLLTMVFVDPKTGHIVRIMSMVSPLGEIETIIRNAMGGILMASTADGERGERTVQPAMMKIFQRLTQEALTTSSLKGEVEDGFVGDGVRYTVKVSKTMGFWFIAEREGLKPM